MTTSMHRLVGAAALDARTYEDVEAGTESTGQAAAVVLMTSVAGAIGLLGLGMSQTQILPAEIVRALLAWIAWALLVYFIGVRLLPGPETRADLGELLRTLGFASTPGLSRILGTVPRVGFTLYLLASLWMLFATVVAVRHSRTKELRLVLRAVSDFIRGFRVLHFVGPCVTVFGSARFPESHPYYALGRQVGGRLTRLGFTVMTAGGRA